MPRFRRTTMAAAQAAYDNMEPPEDRPVLYRCEDCGELFTSDDQRASGECPHCDGDNICEHEQEPYYPEPDE